MTKAIIVAGIIFAFLGMTIGLIYVSSSNSEISLKNKIEAQQQVCEASFDNMWKILNTQASVPEQYKNAMKEIYIPLIEGRYGNEKGGTLMKWIQEHNPTFDASLYTNLMASIEAERKGFFMEQKKLIDLDREHKVLRQSFPASMLIGSRPDVPITIITSAKTEEAYKTGQENEIDLFKK